MERIRLSIIIPFYNVEQYIAQCLDSVYDQDIPEEAYEVICVNDASPDCSRDIVVEYQKKHSNLILVEHESNKKLGAARNTGRSVARGKYIWNVDSDDMIASNCLKAMLGICEKNDLDVLLFGCNQLVQGTLKNSTQQIWIDESRVCSGLDFWNNQGLKHIKNISAVWVMMIKREFLDKKSVFSPPINMNEDVPYTYKTMLLSNRMMAINTPYYVYRVNEKALTGQFRKSPTAIMLYEDGFVCGKALFEVLKQIPIREKAIRRSIIQTIRYQILDDWKYFSVMNDDGCKQYGRLVISRGFSNLFLFRVLNRKQLFSLYKKCMRLCLIGKE